VAIHLDQLQKVFTVKAALAFIMFAMSAASPAARAVDVTDLSLEQLLSTEFVPANRRARQISDASSAVSIVTARDIQDYGYRTLAEILNSMKGLVLSNPDQYFDIGGRGYGIPGDYAGRVLLFIDGMPANDAFFNQIYFGEDGLIEVDLIKQVEYVPGPGSTLYGNNALLGSIHITTFDGGDLEGTRVSYERGDRGGERLQLSYGKQFDNSAHVLASISGFDDGTNEDPMRDLVVLDDFVTPEFNALVLDPLFHDENRRAFFKGAYKRWAFQTAYVERDFTIDERAYSLEDVEAAQVILIKDKNQISELTYDAEWGQDWAQSFRLRHGAYRYIEEGYVAKGNWWGGNTSWAYSGFERHSLIFGLEYRDNFELRTNTASFDFGAIEEFDFDDVESFVTSDIDVSNQIRSVFVQDAFQLNKRLLLSAGLRYDSSTQFGAAFSPRVAANLDVTEHLQLKLSHGRAFRFLDAAAENLIFNDSPELKKKERVEASELVADYRFSDKLSITGSLYKNKIKDALNFEFTNQSTIGRELELHWHDSNSGFNVRASYSKQSSSADYNFGNYLINAPDEVFTFNIAKSWFSDRITLGLDAKHVGRRLLFFEEEVVPASTLVNANMTFRHLVPNFIFSFRVNDLKKDAPRDSLGFGLAQPEDRQGWWLQAEYIFK